MLNKKLKKILIFLLLIKIMLVLQRNKVKAKTISNSENSLYSAHFNSPINSSNIVKAYLNLLPIYKKDSSLLLKGLNIGIIHGYFIIGPFFQLGPLRNSKIAPFVALIASIGLIFILVAAMSLYYYVNLKKKDSLNIQNQNQYQNQDQDQEEGKEFISGFTVGSLGGISFAFILIELFNL